MLDTCSIENNFWSSDKTALNILLEKLDQSNKTNVAIQDFFNQRAQIELEYGTQLLKLSETFNTQHDENFNIISNTTEMNARAHMDLSENIKNLLEIPLNNYFKEQENIKLFMTNQMKESQNMKMLHGDNVKKSRQLYIHECQKPNPSEKETEILDCEYQKAINLMQSKSYVWIHDWRESCKTFQSLESNRLDYLKAVIKTFASMTACTFNVDDQTCDRLLTAMEDMDVDEQVSKFITDYGTGSTLPEIPKYTKYKRDNREILQLQETRMIKEINIPTKHDEQLRSVNEQLKKMPSPWDNNNNTKNQTSLSPPLQYPLDPLYKSNTKSKSDPILSNLGFHHHHQDVDKIDYHKNKSTLTTSYGSEERRILSTPTNSSKKTSVLFSSLGFLKKKKTPLSPPSLPLEEKKKRSSLTTLLIPNHNNNNNNNNNSIPSPSSPSVLSPPSPLFSQMDFYYSPSDHHHLPSDIPL
ncbi:hypothetical protein BD770DRAFT_378282 [Pilaira anomala]|nr:hypothetical protein BD770DRAFT_378282 [Pilaira anomala]